MPVKIEWEGDEVVDDDKTTSEEVESEEEDEESSEQDEADSDSQSDEDSEDDSEESGEEEASDELVITIGDDKETSEEDSNAPGWVKEVRKTNRELQKRNRELESKLEALEKPVEQTLGAKPKIEDFDYDAEKFETALLDWSEKKRIFDQKQSEAVERQKADQQAWESKLNNYNTAKTSLKVKDFDDAEDTVRQFLNPTQQGIIVAAADRPEFVVYALGKNPNKAKALGEIKDPIKFAVELGKLEKDMKVKTGKTPPAPESKVKGNTTPKGGSTDTKLERLRAEAHKTGNFTKLHAYQKSKRSKG